MRQYLTRRSLHSLVSLLGLIVLVFFLARLTGDPTNLHLPLDASLEARAEFAEKHGFNDPLIEQFGRFLGDPARNMLS
jgi:peptide/nickel transport system permease protein